MSVHWKPEFSVGVPEIDMQHKTIFLFLEDLDQSLTTNHDEEVLYNSISFLKDYVEKHFKFEEDCMFKHACPAAADNQEAHRKFLTAFDLIVNRYEDHDDPKVLLAEVQSTVRLWLVNHIMRIDTHLKGRIAT